MRAVKKELLAFELKVRRREISDSYQVSEQVIQIFETSLQEATTAEEVSQILNEITNELLSHFKNNIMITNICNLVKARLSEEQLATSSSTFHPRTQITTASKKRARGGGECEIPRSHSRSFLDMLVIQNPNLNNPADTTLKMRMNEIITSMKDNLGVSYDSIAKQAPNFLFSHDKILTLGYSNSIINFLSARHAGITVFVPERAPEYDGIQMAESLRRNKVNVVVIPDSAVFAILPKINKIIIPVFAVLANGGVVSYSLSHSVALAAKHYAKPFIALYWSMKLTDSMPTRGKNFTTLHQPNQIMSKVDPTSSNVVALNVEGDYIPPDLITLLINEEGAHCPADVFSLVRQVYEEPTGM
ncbi:Initiation factor 2 subunit family protein [Tritrichomonas foetus]|uniref:Translation initiation factor eIF2B subunit beta n=1 Tax=Tritrichomonas foetus TaxID=1144522 RepID=A0A1J4JDK1_9EUKA|nr:Initiation factor 2 subunit family protein [Tritrichomonas foetus]|eukprot:OHS95517.1 Initiation factor 2 subunit family protein [Tritrichomonas foetus]